MPCLLIVLALLLPRVAMIVIFFATPWFEMAFNTWVWPLLGFLFLPYTTLTYMLVVLAGGGGISAWGIIIILIAVLVDIGHLGGSYRYRGRNV